MIKNKTALGALAALCLAACEELPRERADMQDTASRASRENTMNGDWQNRLLAELIAARGQPRFVLNIPGGGNPPGFIVVYGIDAVTGCIDAYAVSEERVPRIRIYHCR